MAYRAEGPRVSLPGVDEVMAKVIVERIHEFEVKHEPALVRNGPGWVPRIELIDYTIAGIINLVIIVWLMFSLS